MFEWLHTTLVIALCRPSVALFEYLYFSLPASLSCPVLSGRAHTNNIYVPPLLCIAGPTSAPSQGWIQKFFAGGGSKCEGVNYHGFGVACPRCIRGLGLCSSPPSMLSFYFGVFSCVYIVSDTAPCSYE